MIMENNVKLIMKVCEDKVNGREQCFKYTGKEGKAPSQPVLNKLGSFFAEDEDNKDILPPALENMMSGASSNDTLPQATFSTTIKDGTIKYLV